MVPYDAVANFWPVHTKAHGDYFADRFMTTVGMFAGRD
jgi:hypothetical protein